MTSNRVIRRLPMVPRHLASRAPRAAAHWALRMHLIDGVALLSSIRTFPPRSVARRPGPVRCHRIPA